MAFFPGMGLPRNPIGWGISPKTSEFSSFEEQAAELQRQKALADALLQRGAFSRPESQGQMVGGRWIAPGMDETIQNAFSAYAGMRMGQGVGDQIADVRKRQREATQDWATKLTTPIQERKAFDAPFMEGEEAAPTGNFNVSERAMKPNELMAHYIRGTELGGPAADISKTGIAQLMKQQAPREPKWEVQDRYNPTTGKLEKVMVDMNAGPASTVTPFGGQKAGSAETGIAKRYSDLLNLGYTPEAARKIVAGMVKSVTDSNGQTTYIDLETGQPADPMALRIIGAPGVQGGQPSGPVAAPAGAPAPVAAPAPQPSVAPPSASAGAPAGPPSPYAPPPRAPGMSAPQPAFSVKGQQALERDVEQISTKAKAANLPQVTTAVKEVNAMIDGLGLKRNARSGKLEGDVPGFGVLQSVTPGFLLSQEGKDLKGAAMKVTNALLASQSGLAVTKQEAERFQNSIQQGLFKTDEDFIKGWQRVLDAVEAEVKNAQAGVHPEALAEFKKRGGGEAFTVQRPRILGGAAPASPTAPAKTGGPNPAAKFF